MRELLDLWEGWSWPGEAIRFNMLRTHYRQPIDWTVHALDESHKILWSWYEKVQNVNPQVKLAGPFLEALCDDLNTPQAIAELHTLDRDGDPLMLSSALNFLGFSRDRVKLRRTAHLEGRMQLTAKATANVNVEPSNRTDISAIPPVIDPKEIDKLIADRNAARKAKDFHSADRIRDELLAMGVVLKDSKEGTTWEIAR